MGEPIGRYVLERGFHLVGIDSSPSLLALSRARYPAAEWLLGDMRQLALGRRFDGILAWDSFFHLGMADQCLMFQRFARHARGGAPLLFTSGPTAGERTGTFYGELLYHASLDPAEYEYLLALNGFSVTAYVAEDPDCGRHTVWLATCDVSVES